jgi:hypothetical protein
MEAGNTCPDDRSRIAYPGPSSRASVYQRKSGKLKFGLKGSASMYQEYSKWQANNQTNHWIGNQSEKRKEL